MRAVGRFDKLYQMAGTLLEIVVQNREPLAEGKSFGESGPYERLVGRVHFEVDAAHPCQSSVVDIDAAPRNARGLVECSSQLYLLKPVTLARGNGCLLFDFVNRGHKRTLQMFNGSALNNVPRTTEDAGDGFLMRRGYTLVWLAWEGDVFPGDDRMLCRVPVAADGGRAITETVRSEFIADRPGIHCFPLSSNPAIRSYPAAGLDTGQASLTCRQYPESQRMEIPGNRWQYARLESPVPNPAAVLSADQAVVPSDCHIYLPDGFKPGWIYELLYPARDPLVLGLGYVAVRDFISFLKYGHRDDQGNPNPLREKNVTIEKALCFGRSQTGRVIRDFIYQGFNADSQGRRVFDPAFTHVAGAGRICLNHRWAQPSRLASFQHEEHDHYSDRFPFSYAPSRDHLTGVTDAILKRPDSDPLLFHVQTSTEYWQRHGSLVHTDTQGNDLRQPEGVRVYFWASSQHRPDAVTESLPEGIGLYPKNDVISTACFYKPLLDHLQRWVKEGLPPPPNRMPTRSEGTLLSFAEWKARFPAVPGVMTPREPNRLPLYDYGPDADRGYLSKVPPERAPGGQEYTILVPAVDEDGNEVGGLRAPLVKIPLGTATGWNLRTRRLSPGDMADYIGSFIPFPETEEERRATADPRVSIRQRYPTREAFLRGVAEASRALARKGFFLLDEDLEATLEHAEKIWHLLLGETS